MSFNSRLLIFITALLLAVTYYFPLWVISLEAPQYPEGLGLHIWINNISGADTHDLNKINNLNHYIGMKHIEPDSIPELKIMPWIMRVVMVSGMIVGIFGRRKLLLLLILLFLAVAIAGFVDFYLWSYDYGHNLDMEKAIIKIPGQSYQPPIIGSKTILNFKAISLPGIGGYTAIGVFIIWCCVWFFDFRKDRK
ncbi:MAG: hypothetical protein DWP97_05960 [Calditrichaeota bacterium]|nr:MAG: hypothetical protein DWP97_05960 [Calditrichota bacterium]